MAFYLEDDDDDDYLESQGGLGGFSCQNCGGFESYEDDGGNMICSTCFTQSQTLNETEMDYEDACARAARSKVGTFVRMSIGGVRNQNMKKDLEEFDKSKPLPTLTECLEGMTSVIFTCLQCVNEMLQFDKSTQEAVEAIVQQTWLGWLKAWNDGAEFYSKRHPDVRFDMRDLMLPNRVRGDLYRYLAAKAYRKVKRKSGKATRVTLEAILYLYRDRNGRHECGLRIRPGLSLVAALLLIPLSKLGVSAQKLCQWITCGKLPLMNAYDSCFPSDLREKLDFVQSTFQMSQVPRPDYIEYLAKLLMITRGGKQKISVLPNPILLATRLVHDMKLGQRVLDLSLGLMGQQLVSDVVGDTLMPFAITQSTELQSYEEVVALVVVACKMCPGWETWKFEYNNKIPLIQESALGVISAEDYFDFFEKNILGNGANSEVADFFEEENGEDSIDTTNSTTTTEITHRCGAKVICEQNPNTPSNIPATRHQYRYDWQLRLGKRKATWMESNGAGKYLVVDSKYHEDYPPHYTSLLEMVAHAAGTPPIMLHQVVVEYDKRICQKIICMKKKKNAKKPKSGKKRHFKVQVNEVEINSMPQPQPCSSGVMSGDMAEHQPKAIDRVFDTIDSSYSDDSSNPDDEFFVEQSQPLL